MRIHALASLSVVVVFGVAAADGPAATPQKAPAAPPAAAPDPTKAEGRFKNIQVLKGHPADDVVPAMQFITASLGVDCDFCHVEHAHEKDDKKEKQTARKMMKMTMAINQANFDGQREVTCVSCHHGATHPASVPAIASAEPAAEPPAPAKPAELPTAQSVLDKYLEAEGGAEAMEKVAAHVQKGKLQGFGPDPIPVDVAAKAPDKRIATVHGQRGDNITALNGAKGWLGSPGRPPRDMSDSESDAARLDAALLFPTDLRRVFKEFEVVKVEPIDGKDAVKVRGKIEGRPSTDLWFDAQTGLVVRVLRYQETPLGRNPTQVDIADYRVADGVKVPHRWTVARPGGRFTIQLDESKTAPVDDKTFEKAAPPPSPPPAS
jgi:hypothetical protein